MCKGIEIKQADEKNVGLSYELKKAKKEKGQQNAK